MLLKNFDLESYLFGLGKGDYSTTELKAIEQRVRQEMEEIFYGKNMLA
jgi:S-adenosylmethionine decarboxylase